MRIQHYTKNLFVFLPLFFAQELFNTDKLLIVALGFLAFSCTASAVYIFNDYKDRKKDALHPEKKNRPLAAGLISATKALIFAVVLLFGSLLTAYFLSPLFLFIVGGYFIMNFAYSQGLKTIAVLDITIIAIGFLLRVIAGGVLADVAISHWILIMTFLLALFLALAKRRDDVAIYEKSGQEMRQSIYGYNFAFINAAMVLMAGVIIVSYLMYTISPEVVSQFQAPYLFTTTFFVLLGVIRYLQITFVEEKSGNPAKLLLKDVFLQVVLLGWLFSCFYFIYANKVISL